MNELCISYDDCKNTMRYSAMFCGVQSEYGLSISVSASMHECHTSSSMPWSVSCMHEKSGFPLLPL
jgi:hypothetical protein